MVNRQGSGKSLPAGIQPPQEKTKQQAICAEVPALGNIEIKLKANPSVFIQILQLCLNSVKLLRKIYQISL